MNTEHAHGRPEIRRLWRSDLPALADHFRRLDFATRRLRFGGAVKDRFVEDYAREILSFESIIFGAIIDEELRGVAELRGLVDSWPRSAELALSVEPAWQDGGIGDALLTRIIASAQNRGVATIHMLCLRENRRMQSLAKKHSAVLNYSLGDVQAKLRPSWPTPISIFEEVCGNTRSFLEAVFQPRH